MLKANYNDKEQILDILCASFDSNLSVNYVVKQDRKRKRRIRILMNYSFEMCFKFGQIYLSDDKEACALTLFPDKKKVSLKTILLDVRLAIFCIGLKRVPKVLKRDLKIKSIYPGKNILYLWFIGVDPHVQNQGIGTILLTALIQESKHLKHSVYLETSVPENVKFYRNQGFRVYQELDFGHRLYLIKRDNC